MVSLIAFPILVAVIYAALSAAAEARRPLAAAAPRLALPAYVTPTFRPAPPPPAPPPPVAPPPPAPVWHAVLSSDTSERALLETLRAQPADTDARMVYADWLESRGDLARAQFVRGVPLTAEQHDALVAADPGWRAITSCARIACSRPACPRQWSALAPQANDEWQRGCDTCGRTVRYCSTLVQLHHAHRRGELSVDEILTPSPPKQSLDFDLTDRAD